jgi:SAM-dependent methyltransferase
MNHVVSRSVSGIQWRGKALLQSYTPVGRKRLAPVGIAIDKLGLPLVDLNLSPENFLLPMDFLPDNASLAGSSIAQFRALVSIDHEPADNDHLAYLLKNHGQEAMSDPVVVVRLKDGRWMVLHGERVVAAALKVGMSSISVQVIPQGEALAGIGDIKKIFYPTHRYRINLALLKNMGTPADDLDATLVEMAKELQANPLPGMGQIHHRLPFPEFQGLKFQTTDQAPYTRLGMILERLENPAGKKVLDLGCNVGFLVFSLAFRECRVSGLDNNSSFVEVGQKVAAAKGIGAQFIAAALKPGSFGAEGALAQLADHPLNDPEGRSWDLITCFSMLQWVDKHHDITYCRRILREISHHTQALLVDIPVNCSGVYLEAPEGREISWVEKFLRSSCEFKEYHYVGKVSPHRTDHRHIFYCHH